MPNCWPTPTQIRQMEKRARKFTGRDKCNHRGFHDFQELIDPRSGGFQRCRECGLEQDCEDPDGDVQ